MSLIFNCVCSCFFYRDIFSRFCYFIRGVAHDPSHFEAELRKLDVHIKSVVPLGGPFLLGQEMSLLDLEVLPKLHQARVASAVIKGKFTEV